MRRVVYREIGGKRRRRASSKKRPATPASMGAGFGRMLSRLLSASLMLETSRSRGR